MFLLFDAYGTLCELDDFSGRLQRGFANLGHALPMPDVKLAARAEMVRYISKAVEARDFGAYIRIRRECAGVLLDALRERGHAAEVKINVAAKLLGEAVRFRAYPETRGVLESLRRREVPMAVVSNWDYRLPQVLKQLQVREYFSFSLTSAQVGVAKPDPQIFARALEMAKRARPDLVKSASDCVYIGDNWDKDVRGAIAAGMRAVWIQRDARDVASGDAPNENDDERELEARGLVKRLRSLKELLETGW